MDMLNQLAELLLANSELVVPIIGIFTRLSVFLFMLPGIGETTIPVRVKLIAAFAMTWIIVPVLLPLQMEEITVASGTLLIVKESMFGFLLAFAFRLMVFTLQILGNVVSQALSISQVLGEGITTEPNTTISTMFTIAGITLLVSMNLHVEVIGVFIRSYETFPLGTAMDTEMTAFWVLQKTVEAFTLGVTLALPFIILNFIYNLIIGFLNRAMPQLMVSFIGMPAITGAGLLLLVLAGGVMLTVWLQAYMGVFDTFPGIAG